MCQQVKLVIIYFLFTLVFVWQPSYALKSDQSKPANVTADSVIYNRNTGVGIYTGHVTIIQGTTKVTANKMITYNNKKNKVDKVIAFGKPAHYQTLPKLGEHILHARANKIEYFPQKKLIIMIGNCIVTQGVNVLKGPKIIFNSETNTIKTAKEKGKRTTIIFTPNKIPKANKAKS